MTLGYDGKLYILAFDHRGSFQKKMFGIAGDPTPEATAVLIDEQFGSDVPALAREHGLKLAMPVEKSGQNEFDFDYGAEFGAHILKFDPDFSKVLVRYNPDDPDAGMNER